MTNDFKRLIFLPKIKDKLAGDGCYLSILYHARILPLVDGDKFLFELVEGYEGPRRIG